MEADLPDVEELRAVVMDYLAQSEHSGLVPMDLRRIYPCRCGTEGCRGTLARPPEPAPKRAKKKVASR